MPSKAIANARVVLNNGMVFVSSRALTRDITGQSISEFIEEQLARIEGLNVTSISSKRRNPRPGEIARIEKVRQDIGLLVDSIIRDPDILTPDPTKGLDDKTTPTVDGPFRA